MNEENKFSTGKFFFGWFLPITIAFLLGLSFQQKTFFPWNKAYSKKKQALRKLESTFDLISDNYVEEVSIDSLTQSAIRGVTDRLDPYSEYFSPEQLESFQTEISGNYVGLGMEVRKDEETSYVRVVLPFRNSPAKKAGIKSGDLITTVKGTDTSKIPLEEAVSLMKGKEGTEVTVTVRSGSKEETLTLKRARIKRPTVPLWGTVSLNGKSTGYIVVRQFTEQTASDFKDALNRLKKVDIDALLIDLRMNRGGSLEACLTMSDFFLSKGKKIITIKYRRKADETKRATSDRIWQGKPVCILVNEGTASASEVFSGAMQDHDIASLVGTRTYGKGSVQKPFRLPGQEDAVKLTIAKYLTPSGKSITPTGVGGSEEDQKKGGLEPDHYVEMGETKKERTKQLNKLTESWDRGKSTKISKVKELGVYQDPQMKKALDVLRGKLHK